MTCVKFNTFGFYFFSEFIVVVKNKIDKNILIKIKGFGKENVVEKAMNECMKKNVDGCYVHYSSKVAKF